MDLHTDDLAVDGRTRREQQISNFKTLISEDANDDAARKALDDKYFRITDNLMNRCTDLEKGENSLDSDKASKTLVLYLFKELDDKAIILDDKKASKKHVRETFAELSQLIQNFKEQMTKQAADKHDELVKTVNDNHDNLVKLVNENAEKMNDKAERIALGTDMDTIRQAVTQVLQEQGIIKRTNPSIPDIKEADKASKNASQVSAVIDNSDEDSRRKAANAAADQLGLL